MYNMHTVCKVITVHEGGLIYDNVWWASDDLQYILHT